MPQIKVVTLDNLSSDFVANTSTKELHVNPAQVVRPYLKTLNGNEVYGTGNLSVTDLGADPSGTASSLVNAHDNSDTAHLDLRLAIAQRPDLPYLQANYLSKTDAAKTYATTNYVGNRFLNYSTTTQVDDKDSAVRTWVSNNFITTIDAQNFKTPFYINNLPTPETEIKVAIIRVKTDSDGLAVVNFSSAGFTSIVGVVTSAESQDTGTASGNAAFCSYFKGTLTNTSVQIRTKSANSAGLLAAMVMLNTSALATVVIYGR